MALRRIVLIAFSLSLACIMFSAQAFMYEQYPSRLGEWGCYQGLRFSCFVLHKKTGDPGFAKLQRGMALKASEIGRRKVNWKEEAFRTIFAAAKGFDLNLAMIGIVPLNQRPLENALIRYRIVPKQIAEAKPPDN